MIKWFSAGAGFILGALLTDIFTVNKFARSTFRALVGVDTYVTENGPTLVDNYISSTRFLNGSYTPSSKQ